MIAACSKHSVIGINNKLPWTLRGDLSLFAKKTIGGGNNAIIMGRKTWQSMPTFLPKRDNFVLSKTMPPEFLRYPSGNQCGFFPTIDAIKEKCKKENYDTIWIIGGETIYKQFINDINLTEIHITDINYDFDGDTCFPPIPPTFTLLSQSKDYQEERIKYNYKIYVNKQGRGIGRSSSDSDFEPLWSVSCGSFNPFRI